MTASVRLDRTRNNLEIKTPYVGRTTLVVSEGTSALLLSFVFIVVGVALLYWGGELLVEHSIHLAKSLGVSSMVIGLTVVAFATSAPELAATLTAAFSGSPDLAVGNAFGSNITNLGLILAISTLVMPIDVTQRFLRREMAFMLLATILVYPLMVDGQLERWEGGFLFLALVAFLWRLIRNGASSGAPPVAGLEVEDEEATSSLWRSIGAVAVGVVLLVTGAKVLVQGATAIALGFGVPERVIGLTLVALGTSLPELAASVAAARRRAGDLVLGNIVGSNIFNLLCILGLTSLAHPIAVPAAAMGIDFWVMFGISALTLLFLTLGSQLSREEGVVLLLIYVGYSIFLFLP